MGYSGRLRRRCSVSRLPGGVAIGRGSRFPQVVSGHVGQPQARRHVDCALVTNDLAYVPRGRLKPDFAAMRYLREWSNNRGLLTSLLNPNFSSETSAIWRRPGIAGRDFLMDKVLPELRPALLSALSEIEDVVDDAFRRIEKNIKKL